MQSDAREQPEPRAPEQAGLRLEEVRVGVDEFGLAEDRIRSVAGNATAAPMFPNDPYLAGNGRVEIVVNYAAPPVPANLGP